MCCQLRGVCSASLHSTQVSDDSHIYADPVAYDDLSHTTRDPVPHLDPAHITIEAVTGRSTSLHCSSVDNISLTNLIRWRSLKTCVSLRSWLQPLKPLMRRNTQIVDNLESFAGTLCSSSTWQWSNTAFEAFHCFCATYILQ